MNIIETVVHAADNEIVGKIRTQKIFYLLERIGIGTDFSFSYHHYGPYSHDLANLIDATVMFGENLKEKQGKNSFGNTYSIFSLHNVTDQPEEKIGDLDFSLVREIVEKMKSVPSVVIELAATIYWLNQEEKVTDWNSELKSRKPQKATDVRIDAALKLLEDINLKID